MNKLITLLIVALVIGGCMQPNREYVEASRDAFAVIVPAYVEYLKADSKLPEFDRNARAKSAQEALKMAEEELVRLKGR